MTVVTNTARVPAPSPASGLPLEAAQLRLLLDNLPALAWIADASGYIFWYNRAWYAYSGATPAEMEGWGWQALHDPAVLPDVMARWTSSIQTGEPFEMTFPLRGADGVFRPFLTRIAPVAGPDGTIAHWCGTNSDVSDQQRVEAELRDREARFRVITEAMPQMVWSTRPDGFHDFYNRRWYEFTGVPDGSTDGEGWNGMFHPDDQERAWAAWRRCLETGENYEIEYRLRHRSGAYRWVLGRAVPIRDADGRITRWMGTCTDIDEQRRTRDALAARSVDLEAANDEIQRFAYIVSHDLRTPLVNILGFTAELENARRAAETLLADVERVQPALVTPDVRSALAEDLPEALRFIRASTGKMDRLIGAILKLSREGRRVLAPEPIDLTALIGGIADTLRHQLDDGGSCLEVGALPVVVSDRLALEQVFGNLLDNAVKYLDPARPGRIRIEGVVRGGWADIAVIDNGRGIDPHDHGRVFDLFRRSGIQDRPGEGIGLAHVRALVRRLGGLITLESAAGAGARFTVTLPLRGPAPADTAEGAPS
jgi:PAS domain S-box-containing protein